jgi:hypothetical protein
MVALSALMLVASATFWVRSYRGQEVISRISFISKQGHVVEITYLFEPGAGGMRLGRHTWVLDERTLKTLKANGVGGWSWNVWPGAKLYYPIMGVPMVLGRPDPSTIILTRWTIDGFQFDRSQHRNKTAFGNDTNLSVTMPFWFACLVFAALPIESAVRVRRWVVRKRRGFCTECGYDLRGSGDRCPECGRGYVSKSSSDGALPDGEQA